MVHKLCALLIEIDLRADERAEARCGVQKSYIPEKTRL